MTAAPLLRSNPLFSRSPHQSTGRAHRISVAPMMDRTDPHWRRFVRLLTRETMLYTEMIPAQALIRNSEVRDRQRPWSVEHPVTVQVGGSDVNALAAAAQVCDELAFDEINLNCGCPSERVASNGDDAHQFGAALMRSPRRVAEMCAAMRKVTSKPVTVKCRLGVDSDDSYEFLHNFVRIVAEEGGVSHFIIHARKALLKGLSPSENRSIPPLRYEQVHRIARDFPNLRFSINGGFTDAGAIREQLSLHSLHGVMVGRHAVQSPSFLSLCDSLFFGVPSVAITPHELLAHYADYCTSVTGDRGLRRDPPLSTLLRPIMPLFDGIPGAKHWRQQMQVAVPNANNKHQGPLDFRNLFKSAAAALPPSLLDMPVYDYKTYVHKPLQRTEQETGASLGLQT